MQRIDIEVGSKFGRWTVTGPSRTRGKRRVTPVECECGNLGEVDHRYLRSGESGSCGCLKSDVLAGRNKSRKLDGPGIRARGRALIDLLKDVPCADCGVRYPPWVMDFDHRPGEVKTKAISLMVTHSETKIRAEAAKCDVVCCNCHRQRSQERRSP